MTELTGRIVDRGGLTTLMVTHNMEQALKLGNRLIMMHEGRIVFEADAARKKSLTVPELMAEFGKIKGAQFDDRALLT